MSMINFVLSLYELEKKPRDQLFHRIKLYVSNFREKNRNRLMLFDETLIELFDTDMGFKRINSLTV